MTPSGYRCSALRIAILLGLCAVGEAEQALSVSVEPNFVAAESTYDLPDVSRFTVATIRQSIPARGGLVASVADAADERLLSEAFRRERGDDLRRRQGSDKAKAYVLRSGVADLMDLVAGAADADFATDDRGVVTLRVPLVIGPDATLVIDGKRLSSVRLSTDRGAFIANGGTLYVIDTEVVGWNEAADEPSQFVDKRRFRPFLASYVRSKTYLAGSRFAHLGYAAPTAYGISLTTQPERQHGQPTDESPTGQIVDCVFEELYYGFYSFEAQDVAIVGNTYDDSIVYGIDPHDRSTRLVIVGNTTTGTRERHGIIGSRGISDSWIVDNTSYANHGSGVMLDRQCTSNVVAGNRVYDNGQGIAIYESSDNLLKDNLIVGNAKSAIRIRNSTNLRVINNTFVDNGDYAVELSAKKLSDHAKRDARGDLYDVGVAASVVGNASIGNRGFAKATGLGELLLSGNRLKADLADVERRLGKPMADTDRVSENRKLGGDLRQVAEALSPAFEAGGKAIRVTGRPLSEMAPSSGP
ncbi:MAG: right-handed parallel beta-helix repeat-containing protein [Planctomycetota bacterium]